MIGYVSGKLLSLDENIALVDVQGVGYELHTPNRGGELSPSLISGAPVRLHVYTHLRENALELYGFDSTWEKKVFLLLLSVSGIGPKTALNILAAHDPEWLLNAISRQDKGSLTRVPGVGKKTAERIALEISDKAQKLVREKPIFKDTAAKIPEAPSTSPETPVAAASAKPVEPYAYFNEAVEALVSLGYRDADALVALREVTAHWPEDSEALTLETLIRNALQFIARARKTESKRP